jgi:LysM repeat protein
MKRMLPLCLGALLVNAAPAPAQDPTANAAAIASRQEAQENYNMLKGHVDDLLASQAEQQKRLQEMAREISELRQESAKPNGNYATQDDLKQLTQAIQEIDKKREADKELILKEMEKLGKAMSVPVSHSGHDKPSATEPPPAPVDPNQPGYYYIIKKNDYLSLIAQKYSEQGIKVTTKQILEANPGLNPNKLIVGKKIFIPDVKAK